MKTSQLIRLLNAFLEADGDQEVTIQIQTNDSFDTVIKDNAQYVQYDDPKSNNITITGYLKN